MTIIEYQPRVPRDIMVNRMVREIQRLLAEHEQAQLEAKATVSVIVPSGQIWSAGFAVNFAPGVASNDNERKRGSA